MLYPEYQKFLKDTENFEQNNDRYHSLSFKTKDYINSSQNMLVNYFDSIQMF